MPAHRVGPPAPRARHGCRHDPAGGGHQRARGRLRKGCYVGQETVARLHHRGKPNRHLRGLRLSEPAERRRRDPARREAGRARSAPPASHRGSGRSPWPWFGARPRPATRCGRRRGGAGRRAAVRAWLSRAPRRAVTACRARARCSGHGPPGATRLRRAAPSVLDMPAEPPAQAAAAPTARPARAGAARRPGAPARRLGPLAAGLRRLRAVARLLLPLLVPGRDRGRSRTCPATAARCSCPTTPARCRPTPR